MLLYDNVIILLVAVKSDIAMRYIVIIVDCLTDVGVGGTSAVDQQSRVSVPLSPQVGWRSRVRPSTQRL